MLEQRVPVPGGHLDAPPPAHPEATTHARPNAPAHGHLQAGVPANCHLDVPVHAQPGPLHGHPHAPVHRMSWEQALRVAGDAAAPLPAITRRLASAAGHALAAPLAALTDLPAFDTSAMDGWAAAGPGPWLLVPGGILAGEVPGPLAPGTAIAIATGAPLPAGATAVLRAEDGDVIRPGPAPTAPATASPAATGPARGDLATADAAGTCVGAGDGHLAAHADAAVLRSRVPVPAGRDIRRRGQECATGMTLLEAGATVTPAVLALAAAAGHDRLRVHRKPSARLLVTGSEITRSGIPRGGQVRDALGPFIASWLGRSGAQSHGARMLGDEAGPLREEVRDCLADVIITTGATSAGPTDVLHDVLRQAGARLLVDSVAVRPGHPMLLAELPPCHDGPSRWLVGLPGNPLAAIAGLLTLALPLLRALGGHPAPAARTLILGQAIPGHPHDTRLVPALATDDGRAVPLPFDGPAMLRGVATADVLAVIPPGGATPGARVRTLALSC